MTEAFEPQPPQPELSREEAQTDMLRLYHEARDLDEQAALLEPTGDEVADRRMADELMQQADQRRHAAEEVRNRYGLLQPSDDQAA